MDKIEEIKLNWMNTPELGMVDLLGKVIELPEEQRIIIMLLEEIKDIKERLSKLEEKR